EGEVEIENLYYHNEEMKNAKVVCNRFVRSKICAWGKHYYDENDKCEGKGTPKGPQIISITYHCEEIKPTPFPPRPNHPTPQPPSNGGVESPTYGYGGSGGGGASGKPTREQRPPKYICLNDDCSKFEEYDPIKYTPIPPVDFNKKDPIAKLRDEFYAKLDSIITDGIKDNKRLMDIYSRLRKINAFEKMIKHFEPESSIANIRFSIDSEENNSNLENRYALTTPPKENNWINVIFNKKYISINKRELELVDTFIHEVIHATIFRWLLIASEQGNLDIGNMTDKEKNTFVNNLKNNFPGLYDYYIINNKLGWDHEQMANHFIPKMAKILQEYDNNSLNYEIYEAIAWSGLMETSTWEKLPEKRKNIINLNYQ
ncbi:hypothetical protein MWN41_13265, partial [Ornithobacterium rhinotracheale]|nr:hypothetical protein [Ornithobacterium rhinotracheale]